MHADGLGWIWVPNGLKDGPLPTHYEPLESPVANASVLAADESGRGREENVPTTRSAIGRRPAIPARPHDLPPDRASHRWRHVAHAGASLGAAAGALLRDLAGARAGDRRGERRDGLDCDAARSDPGARARDAADAAARRAGPHDPPGRVAVSFRRPRTRAGDVVNDLVAISEEPNVRIMEVEGASVPHRPRRGAD